MAKDFWTKIIEVFAAAEVLLKIGSNMDMSINSQQKETILKLLKSAYKNKNFSKSYLFSYKDYFNIKDGFTNFADERGIGKQEYLDLIENLLAEDKSAKVFVEVDEFEEYSDDRWIYADTLIVFSSLELSEIKNIFNRSEEYCPRDIGKLNDLGEYFGWEEYLGPQRYFVLDENGELICLSDLDTNTSIYCCSWY